MVRAVKTNAQTVELLSTYTHHNMTFTWGPRRGGRIRAPYARRVCAQVFQNRVKRDSRAPSGLGVGRSWRISAVISGGNALKRRGYPYGSLSFGQAPEAFANAKSGLATRPPRQSANLNLGHILIVSVNIIHAFHHAAQFADKLRPQQDGSLDPFFRVLF